MTVNGEIFWGNLIINLIEQKMEGMKIEDAQKILKEVESILKSSGITFTDVNIHKFIEENVIGEITYGSGVIFSPYSYLGNKPLYFVINTIKDKADLLKTKYTEEQLNGLVDTLNDVSNEFGEQHIKTEILPRYKRHYQVGVPVDIINTIDEVFAQSIKDKDSMQVKKEKI